MQRCIEQGSFSRGSNERQDYYLRHLGGVLTGAITPGHLDAPIISVRYGLWKFKNSFHNLLWLPLHGHWLCALEKAERPAGKALVLELASMLTRGGVQAAAPPGTYDPVPTTPFETTEKTRVWRKAVFWEYDFCLNHAIWANHRSSIG